MGARLNVVAGIMVLGICAGLFAWRNAELSYTRERAANIFSERQGLCFRIVRDRSARLHQMVIDFAAWPEFTNVFGKGNAAELAGHTLPVAERRKASFRLIDLEGKTIYESPGLPKSLEVRPVWFQKDLGDRVARSQFAGYLRRAPTFNVPQLQYFFLDQGNLYEAAVSPLYGKYPDAKSTPIGFIVACQQWTADALSNLGMLTETTVQFTTHSGQNIQKVTDTSAELRVDIPGIDDPPLGDFAFTFQTDLVKQAVNRTRTVSLICIGLIVLACAAFLKLTQCWLVSPIQRMGHSLNEKSPDPVSGLVNDPTEVGRVAKALIQNFDQKLEMEAMTQELTILNDELKVVNLSVRKSNDKLSKMNEILEAKVLERTAALRQAYEATIIGWSKAMDSKDQETEGHTQRVANVALRLAQSMGLSEKQQQDIYYGALVHDIGKIGIPDAILLKPDKLTPEEFEVMKTHTRLAFEMLKDITFLKDSLAVPLSHHERWDGTGYPEGLSGDEIPFLARVFAVADVWDALRSDRPYRSGWSEEHTREYIASQSGTHFDPVVVEAFLAMERVAHPSDLRSGDEVLSAA